MTMFSIFYKISGLLIAVSTILTSIYAQSYDKSPIAISDIEKGINDIDFMRAVLLEKGFKFDRRDCVYNICHIYKNI